MEVKQAAPKVAKIDMSLDEVVKTGLCRHTVPCAQPTVPRWRAHSGRRQPRLSLLRLRALPPTPPAGSRRRGSRSMRVRELNRPQTPPATTQC